MVESFLTVVDGLNANKVQMMFSYDFYCQLLTARKIGIDKPVDSFDDQVHSHSINRYYSNLIAHCY